MARASKTQNPTILDKEQEEMTVVILRFKGGGDTLRKGFDTVTQALAALGPATTPRQLPQRPETNGAPGIEKNGNQELAESVDEDESEETSETPQREASSGRNKRTPPKFLSNFNLDGDGTKWKEYALKKNPQTENDKYLIAALWVTKHGGQETFKASHVFTCFRAMGWTEQVDFTQPMRVMMKQKSYNEFPTPRQWKLTGHGLETAEAIGTE